jgi:Xaa-Pro aminopeptidase
MKKIYGIVRDAQAMAIEKAHSSMSSKQLDTVARDYITQKGYGEYFGHGLGHGLGIEVHEMPSLSQRHDYQLRENTVVTVEPGIYIENSGGVRIEDDILLKENGCEVLNCSPNELIVL